MSIRSLRILHLFAFLSFTVMTGCASVNTGATEVCAVWRPISWSVKDTPETVDGVKASNARRKAWCA